MTLSSEVTKACSFTEESILSSAGLLTKREAMERYSLSEGQLEYMQFEKLTLPTIKARHPQTNRKVTFYAPDDIESAIRSFRENYYVRIDKRGKRNPDKAPVFAPSTEPETETVPAPLDISGSAILQAVHAGKADPDCADGFFLVVRRAIREWRAAPKSEPLILGERRVAEYLSGETRSGWEVIPCQLTGDKSRQLAETLDKLEQKRRGVK